MKKNLVLLLALSTLSLMTTQEENFRALLHKPGETRNFRSHLHDGKIDSTYKGAHDSPQTSPLSPNDQYPLFILESYKQGHALTPTERALVVTYLRQQIQANDFNYELWHSERMPSLLRMAGLVTMPVRWCIRECYSYFGNWQTDLERLSDEETTETY